MFTQEEIDYMAYRLVSGLGRKGRIPPVEFTKLVGSIDIKQLIKKARKVNNEDH